MLYRVNQRRAGSKTSAKVSGRKLMGEMANAFCSDHPVQAVDWSVVYPSL